MASASGAPQCLVQDLTSILLMQLIYSQLPSRPHSDGNSGGGHQNFDTFSMAKNSIGKPMDRKFLKGRVGSSEFQNVPMFFKAPFESHLSAIWEARTAAMVPRLRHETPVLKPSFLPTKTSTWGSMHDISVRAWDVEAAHPSQMC